MEQIKQELIPNIINIVLNTGNPIDFIAIFGSRAKNSYGWNSDIDIVIVSPFFASV